MRNVALSAGIFTMLVAFGGAACAESMPAKWLPYVDFEARPGSKRSIGEVDIFQPLAQNGSTLLFANVRGRFDDHDNREGNAGLGLRHMLASGWNVGIYGYFDRRRTDYDNYFNQATFGGELLGRDWDFRGNVYVPFGDRVKEVDSLNRAEISGTNVVFRGGEERALRGFDGEVGWRVPVFDIDSDKVLRIYAGGYHFSDDVAQTVAGPRLRAELTMFQVPGLWDGARLTLGAEFQRDDVRGSQGFAMARLRVPLSLERPTTKLSAQERRMLDRVVRDVDIVSQAGAYGAPEKVTQFADGTAFSVINSASTVGNNLRTAVTAAGVDSKVILSGTFQITGSPVSLAYGQSLMAGAINVRNVSGRIAILNSSASILGTNMASSVVQVNAGGTLSGLTVVNNYNDSTGGRAVLVASGATGVTIANNTIAVSQSANNGAVALGFSNGTSGTVSGNTLTATGSGLAGTMTALAINNGTTTVTVSGNSMSAAGGAINNMAWVDNATIKAGSTGNVRGSGSCVGAPVSGSIGFTNGTSCP